MAQESLSPTDDTILLEHTESVPQKTKVYIVEGTLIHNFSELTNSETIYLSKKNQTTKIDSLNTKENTHIQHRKESITEKSNLILNWGQAPNKEIKQHNGSLEQKFSSNTEENTPSLHLDVPQFLIKKNSNSNVGINNIYILIYNLPIKTQITRPPPLH